MSSETQHVHQDVQLQHLFFYNKVDVRGLNKQIVKKKKKKEAYFGF